MELDITKAIQAIIILQIDGRRTLAIYNTPKKDELFEQKFEKKLFNKTKTHKTTKEELIHLHGLVILHRFVTDSHIYIVTKGYVNAPMLDNTLNCIVEVISSLSTNNMNSNTVLDNLTQIIMASEEICDEGINLEVDPNLVLQRISPTTTDDSVESMVQRGARRFFGI